MDELRSSPLEATTSTPAGQGSQGAWLLAASAATAVTLGILALLVATGALTGLDNFAVRRLMPGLYPYVDGGRVWTWSAHTIIPNPNRIVNRVADTVTRPGGALVSTALLVGTLAFGIAAKRTTVRPAAIWLGAFVATVVIEQLGKQTIHRPPLQLPWPGGVLQLARFNSGFPSGHATRAILLAVAVASLLPWRPLRVLPLLWAGAVVCLLVLAGTHALTDVIAGILLGVAVALACSHLAPLHEGRTQPASSRSTASQDAPPPR